MNVVNGNLRVLYDHQIFSWQNYGGISRYFCELTKRVGEDPSFEIQVLAPLYVSQYLRTVDSKLIIGQKIPYFRGIGKITKRLNQLITNRFIVKNNFDIIHETYYSTTRHTSRSRAVITIHDMIYEKFPDFFPSS